MSILGIVFETVVQTLAVSVHLKTANIDSIRAKYQLCYRKKIATRFALHSSPSYYVQ
jgi:hypothetical protein